MAELNIKLNYDPKPIPERRYDWMAIDDDTYEPGAPIGFGATAADAIRDLIEQCEEREGSRG